MLEDKKMSKLGERIAEWRVVFDMFDRDGDGEVGSEEMKKAMQEVGMPEVKRDAVGKWLHTLPATRTNIPIPTLPSTLTLIATSPTTPLCPYPTPPSPVLAGPH